MKVLVTGGAGFIGSNLVDRLIANGYPVVVVDNLSTGFKKFINPKATFYNVDIRDIQKIQKIFDKEKPEVVHHLAAQMDVRVSTRRPIFDATCNIIGSINIILSSLHSKTKKIIYANKGGALYGEVDPRYLPISETYPINPISQYGISKHTVEHYLFLYNYLYKLDYISLRYPNVYGPRQNPNGEAGVIAIFTGKMLNGQRPTIYGNGKQTRDYVYVKDIVDANIIAQESNKNGCYNIGTGKETSVLKIFETLKKETNFDKEPIFDKPRAGEIYRICLNPLKIKRELGWEAKHNIEQGIKKTIEYYKNAKSNIFR